jgi:hypothetical protein
MSRELRRAVACRNCDAEMQGNFCAACGQENTDYRVSLRRLLGDLVDEVFQLESRLWRSLWALFRHPGLLTREYNAGRRVRYTTPLRLYLIASVTYFFVASVRPEHVDIDFRDVHSETDGDTSELVRRIANQFDRRIKLIQKDQPAAARRAQEAITEWGPRVMALLVPLFALLTFALFRRPRHFFVEHLVFALHVHAVVFFLWLPPTLLRHDTSGPFVVAMLVWTWIAARNVFQQSWWRLLWKLPLLGLIYISFVGLGIAGVALWGVFDV